MNKQRTTSYPSEILVFHDVATHFDNYLFHTGAE